MSSAEIVYDGTTGDPTVVAFDPGGVTGWAVFSVHPESLLDPTLKVMHNITHFACGQFIGSEFAQVDEMLQLSADWPGGSFVVEDFILQKFDSSRELLSPVRLTAAYRYNMSRQQGVIVKVQPRSLAFTTFDDARLRAMGFWEQTTGQVHARDSIKHGLTWLKRLKTNVRLRLEVFPQLTAEVRS
jgi:hypothetical protein